jgi:hypothetical protein
VTPADGHQRAAPYGRWRQLGALLAGVTLLLTPAVAPSVPVPGTDGRVDVGGWLESLGVVDTGSGPRQAPEAAWRLQLDAKISRALRGHVALTSRIGGPFQDAHAGPYDLVHTFQNHSPSGELNEAFLELHLDQAHIRAGVQRFAWGQLDGIAPTDVLNPRDFHHPFVTDFEEQKIGIPAVEVTYYAGDVPRLALSRVRATLVGVPLAVPSRLPLPDERWFPTTIVPESPVRLSKSSVNRALDDPTSKGPRYTVDGPVDIPLATRARNHRAPVALETAAVGFRLSGSAGRVDWNLYHYTGPETGPDADVEARVRGNLNVFGTTATPRLHARALLLQTHDTIHMTGVDGSAVVAGASVRAEAAVFMNRPYERIGRDLVPRQASVLRSTIGQLVSSCAPNDQRLRKCRARIPVGDLFPDRDAVEWGLGADYLIGHFFPLLQVSQVVFIDDGSGLVLGDPDTRVAAVVRRGFLRDRLEMELRGVYTLERGGWFALPRFSYVVRDDLRLTLGYLAIGGTRNSLFGQFGRNDELVLRLRYTY